MRRRASYDPLVKAGRARAHICPASDGRSYAGSGATGCFIDPEMPYRATEASVRLRPDRVK